MNRSSRIYVAGHGGLVGAAIYRRLQAGGYTNLIGRRSRELDLTRQADVEAFFRQQRPGYVFLAAAKVGGIMANSTYPAEFIHRNLMIQNNVIHSSYMNGAKKLLFLGSSCIYPKFAPQPIREEHLLTGELEPTNEPYAIAKIAGIKMCQAYNRQYGTDYISVMPTNLYGPNDNFDLETSHVLPAMIRKFHEAKTAGRTSVEIWGTGTPRREFLYIDDLADACVHLMKSYDDSGIINIGVGEDISIRDLALLVKKTVGYAGDIVYDASKPDGTPRKLLDVSRLCSLGWRAQTSLEEGIRRTYAWFLQNAGRALSGPVPKPF
jgi:GDP-L-fucose synthase